MGLETTSIKELDENAILEMTAWVGHWTWLGFLMDSYWVENAKSKSLLNLYNPWKGQFETLETTI